MTVLTFTFFSPGLEMERGDRESVKKRKKGEIPKTPARKCHMGKPPFLIIIRAQPQPRLASSFPHTKNTLISQSRQTHRHTHGGLGEIRSVCQENLWRRDERSASSVGYILEPFAGCHLETAGGGVTPESHTHTLTHICKHTVMPGNLL